MNDLTYLESPLLRRAGFRHAFFTRNGGVSEGPWRSLNFAASTGDHAERVQENLARAAAALGVAPARLYWLSQVHGADARRIEDGEARERVAEERGDVTLSRAPGVACAVRMADCPAVLLADRASGAVAAIHSGWRGAARGVAWAAVEALRHAIGAPGELVAAVGPHIEVCCFEVGEEVADELATASPLGEGAVYRARGARPHVDLRALLAAQLTTAGVVEIDQVRGCTSCDAARFFSYRRDGARSGRMMAAIVTRA
jgi:YfiH family protein